MDTVVNEGNAQAFIPYFDMGENLENVPIHVRADVFYYSARMGFLPNCNKLYLHTPWIAEPMFKMNNMLMRDERNALDEHFKYRMAMLISRTNECEYCTAHHAGTLKRRWEYEDNDLKDVLDLEPKNEREAVAFEFVQTASLDPEAVDDEARAKLAEHFNPQEVMEIVLTVGFWKMYNTMHAVMALPLETPMEPHNNWVKYQNDK